MKKLKTPSIKRKHVAVAVIAAVFLLGILAFAMNRGKKEDTAVKVVEEDTLKYSLRWQGKDYKGTYTGRTANGKPEGTGTFTDEENGLTYSGEWDGGKFGGYGTIRYGDGTGEEGMFLDGNRHHWVRRYESATRYKDGVYDFGREYGCISEYSDGKLVDETLIANGDKVSQIRKDAAKLTGKLIDSKEYVDRYVYITGKVAYLQETDEICYFRIESDSVGMVMGSYPNTAGYRSGQPVVPNMEVDDRVVLYGYYVGTVRDELEEDRDFYEYSCAQFDPVYGELESDDNERGTYASISRNPYTYCGKSMEGDYVVERYMKSGDLFYVFAHPSDRKREHYVLRVEAEADAAFYGGETISLKGFIVGQRKTEDWNRTLIDESEEKLTIAGYKKYPIIRVTSYEIR